MTQWLLILWGIYWLWTELQKFSMKEFEMNYILNCSEWWVILQWRQKKKKEKKKLEKLRFDIESENQ